MTRAEGEDEDEDEEREREGSRASRAGRRLASDKLTTRRLMKGRGLRARKCFTIVSIFAYTEVS